MNEFDEIDRMNSLHYFFQNIEKVDGKIVLQSNIIKSTFNVEIKSLDIQIKKILNEMKENSKKVGFLPKRTKESSNLLKALSYNDSVVFRERGINRDALKFNNNLSRFFKFSKQKLKLQKIEKSIKSNMQINCPKGIYEKIKL
jgi:copper chaperone CopZ